MTLRRAARFGAVFAANLVLRVLMRLTPQRWLHPSITLRIFRTAYSTRQSPYGMRPGEVPDVVTRTDLEYAPGSAGRFDLVLPTGPGPHPVVVWLHGGGWYFGDKSHVLPYLELLAGHGFAGVAVNYPLAPRHRYPAAPRAAHAALAHLVAHAEELGIDPDRIVVAGDSAGCQVAAEVITQITNPTYAAATGLTPALRPEQLRGALLLCGIFDTYALDDSDRAFEAGLESAMWSLGRSRRWQRSTACARMNLIAHVDAAFPPTYLASGTADPLHRRQSVPMVARLGALGVDVDAYLPGDDADPSYHEFQFALGTPAATESLNRTLKFLAKVTSISH